MRTNSGWYTGNLGDGWGMTESLESYWENVYLFHSNRGFLEVLGSLGLINHGVLGRLISN